MKKLELILILTFSSLIAKSQFNIEGNYKISGRLGIGTDDPNSKLEIEIPHTYNQDEEMRIGSYYHSKFIGLGLNYRIDSNGGTSKHIIEYHGGTRYDLMTFKENKIGVGTSNPQYKLDIIGTIRAREIKVDLNGADFVFEDSYNLKTLKEVERYIKENKHLPEIEHASDMESGGTELGKLNTKLLQKIEELTLYLIEQNKKNEEQSKEIEKLKQKISELEK
jgi:hypothetical protein